MKKLYFLGITAILSVGSLFAQFEKDYTPLRAEGDIPLDFTVLSSEKYQQKKMEIEEDLKRSEKKEQSAFYLETTFKIDQILLDGKVLFNDPLTEYVQKVLDNIISKDDSIYQDLQVYVVKSPYVNAFATDRGALFINVGLLAQLSNEAQLAYILCHEIVHYTEKHNMSGYIEHDRIYKERGNYRKTTESEKILESSNYSKELESEADEKGFELFLKTDYEPTLIMGVFDVLQYSYLPIDDIDFSAEFMENNYYKIPANYYMEETSSIESNEDYDDSKSSHPNVKKRRDVIFNLITENEGGNKKGFINSKEEFINAQQNARMELSRLYILERDYAKALYNSFLMLKEYPENKYLKTTVAYSLYALMKYTNAGKSSDVIPNYEKIQGKSQDVYRIFWEMEDKELAVFANAYIWELQKEYPNDPFIKDIAEDALKEMVFQKELPMKQFSKKFSTEDTNEKELQALNSKDYEELSKYEKIKLQKLQDESQNADSSMYAFIGLFDYPLFAMNFDSLSTEYEKEQSAELKSIKERKKELKEKNRRKKLLERKGRALGIDKIVITEPNFLMVDQRKKIKLRYMNSEKKQMQLSETMQNLASKSGLEVEMVSNKGNLTKESILEYNRNAILNDWIEERASHGDLEVIPFESQYTYDMVNDFNTPYFLYSGMYDIRQSTEFNGLAMAFSILYVFPIPFYLYYQLKPNYQTYFYSLLFDIRNGKALMVNDNYISEKGTRDLRNISFYDTFHQIKSTRK